MLHSETIARLREWEARFPVLEWAHGDLHLWPLLRIQLASDLLAAGRPAGASWHRSVLQAPWRRLTGTLGPMLRGAGSTAVATPHDLLCLGRPANRQLVAGVWHERFFDPIADLAGEQGLTCLHLEHRSRGTDYRVPRQRPSMVVTGPVERRIVWARLRARPITALEGFGEFEQAVRARVPVSPVSRWWLGRRAAAVELVARYFEGLFARVAPRIAFCTVYYSVVGSAFCLAARRRGVPVVDMQHGVSVGNPAYQGWSRFPAGGFRSLPAWFWTWSEADAEPVGAWPDAARPAHRVVVGGQPQIALWRSGHPLASALRARLPPRGEGEITILVTLSWSSGFSDRIRELVRRAPATWRWWIRLHPLMERARPGIEAWCSDQAPGRARADAVTDLPLPLLLEEVDVHLTHNSTVVQEAARLGRPSVVIDSRSLDVYVDELRSGWAVYADAPEAILAAVTAQAGRRATLPPLAPYPALAQMAGTLAGLLAGTSCPTTAPAASSPTPARA